MRDKSKPKKTAHRTLPTKSVLADLQKFKQTCDAIVANYLMKVESEIIRIGELVSTQPKGKAVPPDRVADLRDMLMLLRGLEVKPSKGRRRDLKKIENILEELGRITERW